MRRRLLLGLCLATSACTGGDAAGGASTTASPIATVGRSTAAEVPLEVGQCGSVPVLRTGVALDPASIAAVPCEQPHDVEVAAVFEYPASPAIAFPGVAAVDAFATDECLARFEDYVGAPYATSRLDVTIVAPGAAGWAAGDRRVACIVYDTDFGRLTGTVRGAGT